MKIIMDHGGRIKLARDFKVTRRTVYNALSREPRSQLANMLRKAAIERGGVVYDESRSRRAEQ
jgi:DNA-binding phage protein